MAGSFVLDEWPCVIGLFWVSLCSRASLVSSGVFGIGCFITKAVLTGEGIHG